MLQPACIEWWWPANNTMHFISFLQQELRQIGAILSCNTRNEGYTSVCCHVVCVCYNNSVCRVKFEMHLNKSVYLQIVQTKRIFSITSAWGYFRLVGRVLEHIITYMCSEKSFKYTIFIFLYFNFIAFEPFDTWIIKLFERRKKYILAISVLV